jgi:hypothetical protein
MEASSKPQLPLDAGDQGTVRALEDRLVIEALTVVDQRAAQLVRERQAEGQDPARTVSNAIEIGARVLDREEVAAEVDFVRREYERAVAEHRRESERQQREAVERIEREIRRAFGDEGASGILAEALEAHQRELADLVDETFGDGSDEAVPRRIQALIEQRNREFLDRLSADDELNPLRPLLTQFSAWARDRGEAQDKRDDKLERKLDEFLTTAAELVGLDRAREAVEEAEEAGTRKGRTFEDRVDMALDRLASTRGDAASHTGGEGAEGGGRKGDTLIELSAASGPAAGRVVFEAKDKRLSKNDAWRELNEAMAARAASFGVLVVAGEDRIPAGREPLTEYEGNKLIVAVDREQPDGLALEVAYRLAAARVAMARDRDLTVDPGAVRDAAEEAVSCLKQAQAIRATLTGIKTSSDKARATLDEMVESVRSRLERVESLVEVAEPEAT